MTVSVFACGRNFDLVNSIDDHSAAVTSIKLTGNNRKILSCSADRYASTSVSSHTL